jgi:hypothetical protein
MSQLGQSRRFVDAPITSGIPLWTDIVRRGYFSSIQRNRERDDGCCWPLPATAVTVVNVPVVLMLEAVVA